MVKLVLILLCCFVWVGADPFFFNIQKSYVSQPSSESASRPATSQSSSLGAGGIFSKWLLFSQLFTNKLFGVPTQRPRPTQRPVVQIDPVYVPVDLDKENASTPSTEVPAEEVGTTKRSTTSSTTSSYEYSKPSTTMRTTTSTSYEYTEPSTTERTTTSTSYEYTEPSAAETSTTKEAQTFEPTTYRPTTSSTTRRTTTTATTTTTTTTTEVPETEIGYEIDSGVQDKPNEIIEPSTTSTTSTTTEAYEGGQSTQAPVSWTYLPPLIKSRRLSPTSLGLAATDSVSSDVAASNTASTGLIFSGPTQGAASVSGTSSGTSSRSGDTAPFDIISFRGSIADSITGEGLIEEAKSIEVNDIDPRIFYFY